MSSRLAPLLETQELDLAVDDARKRARELPEREAFPALAQRVAEIRRELDAALAERAAMETEEREIGRAVSQLASTIESAELERYAGKRKDRDAANRHESSQTALREQQIAYEEREMELLEAVEALTRRIDGYESELARCQAEHTRLEDVIRQAESEVEASVARLTGIREGLVEGLPEAVLAAYERVRAQARNGGRGAATLAERRCSACRIDLPSLECRRMLNEPEDALIQCPQCRRVLVRNA